MSDRSAIYAASPEDAAEVRRALRICLAGMRAPAALTFGGGDFPAWVQQAFLPVLAPHVMTAHGMARRGDAVALIAADAALQLPPASVQAGRELLAQRAGARHLPVMRSFATAVKEGKSPGHFATVFAIHAADFSVALLPLVQCLLYCEWRGGQPVKTGDRLDEFLRSVAAALPFLPSLLTSHAGRGGHFPFAPVPDGKLRKKSQSL